ncbi:DUF397 domain-containing protein [Streptomyces paradoxus]|uniref:DUF397 domain-containing protein n=1 Tax=Streptomyces paradoxus TaxID=66375 RepID=UPI0037D185A9
MTATRADAIRASGDEQLKNEGVGAVARPEISWHKSSASGVEENCVEYLPVAEGVLIRDSKNKGQGLIHATEVAWLVFVEYITTGRV